MANKDVLLALILALSLISFFLCLKLIPGRASGSMHALLRASAMLLFLCMPSFFYLHFTDTHEDQVLGHLPRASMLWRAILFALGALSFGIFAHRLAFSGVLGKVFLFSLFNFYKDFSLASLGGFLTYAFVSAFLPFAVLYSRCSSASAVSAVLSMGLLYAALGFSLLGAPVLFLFGCLLALLRMQSASFLAVFSCNLAFLFGAYGDRVGVLSFLQFKIPTWGTLALFAGVGLLLLCASIDYRFFGKLSKKSDSLSKRAWTPWVFVTLLLLGAVLVAILLGGKR